MQTFLAKIRKNSLCAALYEWEKDLAGYDFGGEFIRRYLLPTGRTVTSVPCSRHKRECGVCRRMNTALFGSEIRAFCPRFAIPDITLDRSSLVEYRLDVQSFARVLAEKMGFEPLNAVSGETPCVHIAMSRITQRRRIPVYLAVYPYADIMENAVRRVLDTTEGAFVLLTMTAIDNGDILNSLARRNVSVVDLADVLYFDANCEMRVSGPPEDIRAGIREQTPPEQPPHFDLPPDTGWEQLKLKFKNNHDLEVIIGGRVASSPSYKDMGMKNRAGKPNKQWLLLKKFADGNGKLEDPMPDDALRKQIQYLNAALCVYFNLPDNPIERRHGENCYALKFRIAAETESSIYHHKYRK